MKLKYELSLLLSVIAFFASAQDIQPTILKLGDLAPPLRVREWIKGAPIKTFEKGRIYVVEFWATWCAPCNAEMPHLSSIAEEYKDKVTIASIDIYEKKTTSIDWVKGFVRNKGNKMNFNIALEDTNHTVHDWLEDTGEIVNGIPRAFVVDREGKIAWVGLPTELDAVLSKLLANKWDIKAMQFKKDADKRLRELDIEAGNRLARFDGDYYKTEDLGHPDSALLAINEMVSNHPEMKYTPTMVLFTFPALLKTNLNKAYKFGKKAIKTVTYEEPAYCSIIANIDEYYLKVKMSPEIFRLGAEACKQQIEHAAYPELLDMPKLYHKMASWYWKAGEKSRAIKAERTAIKLIKNKFKNTELMPSDMTLLTIARQ